MEYNDRRAMKTIEERVREAFVAADTTGTPQEVLGDDGKRVMLIVCPKDKRPMPGELETENAALRAERDDLLSVKHKMQATFNDLAKRWESLRAEVARKDVALRWYAERKKRKVRK